MVPKLELRAWSMIGRQSTTELHPTHRWPTTELSNEEGRVLPSTGLFLPIASPALPP